jgi:hypothetical protein
MLVGMALTALGVWLVSRTEGKPESTSVARPSK